MSPIYIIGAGGFGKELLFLLNEVNKTTKQFIFKGFIDKNNGEITIAGVTYSIFNEEDKLEELRENAKINIAIAVGNPIALRKIAERWRANS